MLAGGLVTEIMFQRDPKLDDFALVLLEFCVSFRPQNLATLSLTRYYLNIVTYHFSTL